MRAERRGEGRQGAGLPSLINNPLHVSGVGTRIGRGDPLNPALSFSFISVLEIEKARFLYAFTNSFDHLPHFE